MTSRARPVDFLKQRRPVLARDLEKLRGQLPPLLQIRGRDIVEAGENTFFGLDRLDQVGEGAAQPDGVGRVGGGDQRHAAEMIPDFLRQGAFPGQDQIGKAQRGGNRRDRRIQRQCFGVGGIEKTGIVIGFAQRTDRRQDRRSLADEIGELGAQHPGGATGRHEHRGACQ
jgi:hypothetical protein